MTTRATFHSLVLLATAWLGTSLDAATMAVGVGVGDLLLVISGWGGCP